jgi:hypothetical protein
MKRVILGWVFLVALGVSSAWASPLCTDQTVTGVGGNTLDKYIALGASGCTLNGLLFNNFAYSYTMGTDAFYSSGPAGTGTLQPATTVSVTVNAINTSFQFGANWIVNHYQTASLSLTFDVSAPSSLVTTLQNAFTTNQGGTQNGGPIVTKTATCTGGTCGPTDFTNQTTNISGTQGPITIQNTFVMDARGSSTTSTNNVHLSIVSDQFAASQVPEPATFAMFGGALAVLGFLRRRK